VDAIFGGGWADGDDDLDALLRSDILCDPFDLIIDTPALATPTQPPAPAAEAAQTQAPVAVAPDVAPVVPAGAAESDGSAGAAAVQPQQAAAAAVPVPPAAAAAAAPTAPADGGAFFAGSRPCSPRCGADGGGTPAAGGAGSGGAAAAASVVTPGGGAWSAAPAGGGGRRAASPAVSSGADAAVQSPLQTRVQARANGIVYDASPLLPPFSFELTAQMAAAFGSPAPPARADGGAASAGALLAAQPDAAAAAAADAGDVLLVGGGALAPQALIHAATDGLPGGGWETASYTSVVPAHADDDASACASFDGDDGAATQAATLAALRAAAADVRARWPAVARVVLAKRVGGAPPGEVSVVVAVTSPSWAASIAAVTFAVARVKAAGARGGDVAPMEL
jgi:hypothetical protein